MSKAKAPETKDNLLRLHSNDTLIEYYEELLEERMEEVEKQMYRKAFYQSLASGLGVLAVLQFFLLLIQ